MSRNRIELTGKVVAVPEIRTTPSGTPVMRLEVDCGEGRETLRLGIVTSGAAVRELGRRLRVGSAVRVMGALRAIHGPVGSGVAARGVEVIANEIGEVVTGSAE